MAEQTGLTHSYDTGNGWWESGLGAGDMGVSSIWGEGLGDRMVRRADPHHHRPRLAPYSKMQVNERRTLQGYFTEVFHEARME